MKFNESINLYIEKLNCTAKDLAKASELSATVISRYRTGEREPALDSEQLHKLVSGIVKLAKKNSVKDIVYDSVLSSLQNSLTQKNTEYDNFIRNYNTIIDILNINMKTLSSATNFDTSYLYRVRRGQRKPSDLNSFCNSFCRYVATYHTSEKDKKEMASLMGCSVDDIEKTDLYISHLHRWIYQESYENTSGHMENFLKKLDEFNLDEYIRAIHFDELKVPTLPFRIPTSKTYYGIEQMRHGELDFFKSTVLSKSMEPIFMCSDMPMEDMAKDMDFNKKWMFAIAMSLKKGLHLNIIHNIDRPFNEMMLGLESWIPIYMTGQVSPYHLPGISNNIYHHFNYVSGTVALTGECIHGYHKNGKYYLTNNKEEVAYYKQKAANLLSKAEPLMNIYRTPDKKLYHQFLESDAAETGTRHNILSSPPLYTIPDKLLEKILNRTGLHDTAKKEIYTWAEHKREFAEHIIDDNIILDEIHLPSPEEFELHPITLPLSDIFCEEDIPYTYDEYMEHIKQTEEFAKKHANYNIRISDRHVFRNIQIHMLKGKYVSISKMKTPVIHFIIRHPKMVNALENFIAPVVE